MQWIISSKDSSAKDAGKVSKQENTFPEGVSINMGPTGKDESDLIESGEVDALFHAGEPRSYIEGHPKEGRLFPDYRSTERAYFSKTGIFPIMHAVAIKLPVDFKLQAFGNVEKPDCGPGWSMMFAVKFLFPK